MRERLLLILLAKHKSRNMNCLVLDQTIMLVWGNKISKSGFRMRDSFFKPRSGSHPFNPRSQSSGRKFYVDWYPGRRSTCHGKRFLTFYSKLSFLFSLSHTFLNVTSLRRDGHMNYHFLSFIQTKASRTRIVNYQGKEPLVQVCFILFINTILVVCLFTGIILNIL